MWGSSSHASYLPSSSYFFSLIYSEHNTQLVCNKQWYVLSWTFYWCFDDVDLHQTGMRLHNHVVWLVYLPFLTFYVVNLWIHSHSGCKLTIRMVHVQIVLHFHSWAKMQASTHATHVDSYLPSSSYFLSLIYSEHGNTQLVCNKQWYVQSWTFYLCCDDVDLHQTVMRLHNDVVWLVYLPFLTFYVVNLCIHCYSVCKLTIRMIHVHIVLYFPS